MSEVNLIRCDVCMGRKKVLGLGAMKRDCYNCGGIGWLDADEEENLEKEMESKRRGRPPRDKD